MATVSNVVEALKFTYAVDRVQYYFNNESVVYNILSKEKISQGGRTNQLRIPIMVQNPGAVTGISEGGSLPSALNPDTAEAYFDLQEYASVHNLSWKLLQDARSDKFAFQSALDMFKEGVMRRWFRMLNADFIDDGRGRLAVLPAADNDTTITVNALPLVEQGQVVDLMDTDDATKNTDSATVTAVDPIARTVTLSANSGSTGAGDYLVIQDTTDSPNAYHTNGLLGIIDSANPATVVGNYGAINRSTAGNEFWQAVELGNSGTNRNLTEDLLLQAESAVREKGNGKIKAWIFNEAIKRRYHELVRAEAFMMINGGALSGGLGAKSSEVAKDGKTVYTFGGVPFHVDPYFAANTIVGLDTDTFMIGHGETAAPAMVSEVFEGAAPLSDTTSAGYDVRMYFQVEVICKNPSANVKIADVAES